MADDMPCFILQEPYMAALTWAKKLALTVFWFGLKAFVFGIAAEDKKIPFGTLVRKGDFVICRLPAAVVTIAMESLSVASLVVAIVVGHVAALYPYKGNNHNTDKPAAAPRRALLQSTSFIVFFVITELVSASALAMLLWATIAQGRHRRDAQYQLQYDRDVMQKTTTCTLPAAKTSGLHGGGALLALDATLLWLVCQMLALNARADYLDLHGDGDGDDDEDHNKGDGDHGHIHRLRSSPLSSASPVASLSR